MCCESAKRIMCILLPQSFNRYMIRRLRWYMKHRGSTLITAHYVYMVFVLKANIFALRVQEAYWIDLPELADAVMDTAFNHPQQECSDNSSEATEHSSSGLEALYSWKEDGDWGFVPYKLDTLAKQLQRSDILVAYLTSLMRTMIVSHTEQIGVADKFEQPEDWSLTQMTTISEALRLTTEQKGGLVAEDWVTLYWQCRVVVVRAAEIRAATSLSGLQAKMIRVVQMLDFERRADEKHRATTGTEREQEMRRLAKENVQNKAARLAEKKIEAARVAAQRVADLEEASNLAKQSAARAAESDVFWSELIFEDEEDCSLEQGRQDLKIGIFPPHAWSLSWCWASPLECWHRFKQAYQRPARTGRGRNHVQ